MTQWLLLAAALLAIAFVVTKSRERFTPEFNDRAQVTKTIAVQGSSYDQVTNHYDPAPWSAGPIDGHETPFQVNQYRAFVV